MGNSPHIKQHFKEHYTIYCESHLHAGQRYAAYARNDEDKEKRLHVLQYDKVGQASKKGILHSYKKKCKKQFSERLMWRLYKYFGDKEYEERLKKEAVNNMHAQQKKEAIDKIENEARNKNNFELEA